MRGLERRCMPYFDCTSLSSPTLDNAFLFPYQSVQPSVVHLLHPLPIKNSPFWTLICRQPVHGPPMIFQLTFCRYFYRRCMPRKQTLKSIEAVLLTLPINVLQITRSIVLFADRVTKLSNNWSLSQPGKGDGSADVRKMQEDLYRLLKQFLRSGGGKVVSS